MALQSEIVPQLPQLVSEQMETDADDDDDVVVDVITSFTHSPFLQISPDGQSEVDQFPLKHFFNFPSGVQVDGLSLIHI